MDAQLLQMLIDSADKLAQSIYDSQFDDDHAVRIAGNAYRGALLAAQELRRLQIITDDILGMGDIEAMDKLARVKRNG